MQVSRRHLISLPPVMAVAFLTAGGPQMIRRLATDCINTVYATPQDALNMPLIPPSETNNIPAYIALCHEWIRLDTENPATHQHQIIEDERVCMDWSAPHLSLLDMFSAMIVSNHVPGVTYRHSCERTRVNQESIFGFDATTIQQTLDAPGLRTNNDVLSVESIKQQCRRCLLSFNPLVERGRVRSKGFHHCFAFPYDANGALALDPNTIPYVPFSFPGVVPFSSIIIPFRQRLYQAALSWSEVTDKPPEEENSGVVYWLDPGTVGLAFEDVLAEIPNIADVTSVSILTSPLCATAVLVGGQRCEDYGTGLRDYIAAQLGNPLNSTGYQGEHGVTFKIVASTAAAFSRMILARSLVCPPRSPSCLIPSVAKRDPINSALVLDEDGCLRRSLEFISISGHHGSTTVKVLDSSKIPSTDVGGAGRRTMSLQHQQVALRTNCDGYSPRSRLPPVPSDSVIDGLSPQDILDSMYITQEMFDSYPNILIEKLETVPTREEVQAALANGVAIETNQVVSWDFPSSGFGGDGYRHGELSTDTDSGMNTGPTTKDYWQAHSVERQISISRMHHEWSLAFYNRLRRTGYLGADDPSIVFEVQCPSGQQLDGSIVSYTDGVVTTKTPTMLIVSDVNGIKVKDPMSGVTIGTGIQQIPIGTAIREPGEDGYQIKDTTDLNTILSEGRRLHKISRAQPIYGEVFHMGDGGEPRNVVRLGSRDLEGDLPFKAEVQKVCNKYSKRLQRAIAEFDQVKYSQTV